MKEGLNEELIAAVAQCLPQGTSMVNLISDVLSMGKESVYRRLRGEVVFTFDEVAKLSRGLNISLDNIIGLKNIRRAVFDLSLIKMENLFEKYYEVLDGYIEVFRALKRDPESKIKLAFNTFPYVFVTPYPTIAKFQLFRWINQIRVHKSLMPFSTLEMPDKVLTTQRVFVQEMHSAGCSHYLMDERMFDSFVQQVKYFAKLKLINKEEIKQLQQELFTLLSDLENLAVQGAFENGNEVQIYISDFGFKLSSAYFECKEFLMCDLRLYSMNRVRSYNVKFCQTQDKWIESLKRYATLITQSGEIQRANYMEKQRECIMSI
ncbi:MAG: hypothetical protein LBF09_05460 [Odoribacteraceae bacterium]|jgi:uncharacterized protein YlaN (UPF0358 family)|nr:hypothetical protein [Odoribacteraceae bacterium]